MWKATHGTSDLARSPEHFSGFPTWATAEQGTRSAPGGELEDSGLMVQCEVP